MKPTRRLNKPDTTPNLVLEEVIGLTTKNSNGLASSASSSKCVYLAGSVVVVYDVSLGTQTHLMVSHRLPKTLSCVALPRDGRFVAAGEAGRLSSVLVWDSSTLSIVSELRGHIHGVACICFSPNGKHLVSVGGYIYLWDWRSGELVTKLQATSSCSTISSVSFSSDARFVVTAGKKHLKFWVLGSSGRSQLSGKTSRSASLAIHEKPANLAIHKGSSFISIASAIWSNSYDNCKQAVDCFPIYALTDSGNLYLIHSGLSVKKSVSLKVQKAFALSTSGKLIACACNNGIVQLFASTSLEYLSSILYSKAKKFYEGNNPEQDLQQLLASPDAVACQFSAIEKLVVIYGDHSIYIWDIHDVNEATRCSVLVSHSSCIWDIKNLCCENMHAPSLACTARGCSGGISFATCSTDGSIRLWDLALQSDLSKDSEEHHSFKSEILGSSCLVSAGTFERDVVKTDLVSQGFRSLAVSSDGKHLAAGDCKGNLHIYNLQTSEYTCLLGAHDAEILSLSFTLSTQDQSEKIAENSYFLASGGRDCVINLYDVKRNFDLIDSIDDHSAPVTSIKISSNSSRILSCSADSFLVLRDVAIADNGYKILQQHCQKASLVGAVYDMAVDLKCETVVTVGQDKKIKTFDMATRKLIRAYNHDKNFGEPIKVIMDPSCSYVVCSFSNKSICIYDFITGEMVAKAMGHAEIVTGVTFLPDCKHIVSVDGDGCVFVWKLPTPLSSKILERIMERSNSLSPRSLAKPAAYNRLSFCEEECRHPKINPEDVWPLENSQIGDGALYRERSHREASSFKFSVSRLPKWAQAKVSSPNIANKNLSTSSEACATSSPQVQIASDHGSLSPMTVNSQISPRPGGTFSNTGVDHRWLSVYTVCMGALSSPDMQNLMDTKLPEIPLRQDKAVISKDHDPVGLSSHSENEKIGLVSEKHVGCNNIGVSCSLEGISDTKVEQLHLDEPGSEAETTFEANLGNLHCEEDTDMFRQHFGSLSNTHKMKSRNSLVRRFSARYVVQQDFPGDCKRLFSSPIGNMTDKINSYVDEAAAHIISEDRCLHVMETEELRYSSEQVHKNSAQGLTGSTWELTRCPIKENSVNNQPREGGDQNIGDCVGSGLRETIAACKEAFGSLDVAAGSVVHLLLKLEKGCPEEVSSGARAQFLNEAAELLPLIVEKVNAVATLVQRGKNDQLGNRLGVAKSDQLISRFAEGMTDRIMEIPKEDASIH